MRKMTGFILRLRALYNRSFKVGVSVDILKMKKGRGDLTISSSSTFCVIHMLTIYSNEYIEAKIFVEFVALIIRNRIYTYLRKRTGKERVEAELNDGYGGIA